MVTAVNGVIAVAVIVLVAAVALVVRPPSPPGIAEFAPQASKPITKAPPGQASRFGSGSQQCAVGASCAGNAPARAQQQAKATASTPTGVPSALQCFAWPDGAVTQTFDPQSPPCIATWPGQSSGNGGATSAGVTGTEVRVAVPLDGLSRVARLQTLVDFFNTHFELYGRKIVLAPFSSSEMSAGAQENSTGVTYPSPEHQYADAQQARSLHVFAATDFGNDDTSYLNALPAYVETLAKAKILSVSGGYNPLYETDADMTSHAPYEWSFAPTIGNVLVNLGHLVCNELVGRDATHSPDYKKQQRKFALVMPDPHFTGGDLPGQSAMLNVMAGCGITNPPVAYYDPNPQPDGTSEAFSETLVQWKQEGVTSLIYYPTGAPQDPDSPQPSANSIGYRPEWVTAAPDPLLVAQLDANGGSESNYTFGVAGWNKELSPGQAFWYESYLAAGGGKAPSAFAGSSSGASMYEELLLLASGIQEAGARLTPQTFAQGLYSTRFPDPGAGRAPTYQAGVGFGRDQHAMLIDFSGWWLDPGHSFSATTADAASATTSFYDQFCYERLGQRWSGTQWPHADEFFSTGCR